LPNGRRQTLFEGDEIIVAYANRHAPDQFEAEVPDSLSDCHLVASGGVALAGGLALEDGQLGGRARSPRRSAANDLQPDGHRRRQAWTRLAQLVEQEHRADEAARFYRLAALAEAS